MDASPRYIDKVRLHLAGRLHRITSPIWQGIRRLVAGGRGSQHEQFVEVVRQSITDGQVCDWVRQNVRRSEAEKAAHRQGMLLIRPLMM